MPELTINHQVKMNNRKSPFMKKSTVNFPRKSTWMQQVIMKSETKIFFYILVILTYTWCIRSHLPTLPIPFKYPTTIIQASFPLKNNNNPLSPIIAALMCMWGAGHPLTRDGKMATGHILKKTDCLATSYHQMSEATLTSLLENFFQKT